MFEVLCVKSSSDDFEEGKKYVVKNNEELISKDGYVYTAWSLCCKGSSKKDKLNAINKWFKYSHFELIEEKGEDKMIKIKCVEYKSEERYFTLDMIYEFKNGKVISDSGFVYSDYDSVEEFIKWISKWYTFEILDEFSQLDLKSGMIVKRRNNELLMVVEINDIKFLLNKRLATICTMDTHYKNFKYSNNKEWDIIEVFESKSLKGFVIEATFNNIEKTIWKEEIPKVDWTKIEPMTLVKGKKDLGGECIYYFKKYHEGLERPYETYLVDEKIDKLNGYESVFFSNCELVEGDN